MNIDQIHQEAQGATTVSQPCLAPSVAIKNEGCVATTSTTVEDCDQSTNSSTQDVEQNVELGECSSCAEPSSTKSIDTTQGASVASKCSKKKGVIDFSVVFCKVSVGLCSLSNFETL